MTKPTVFVGVKRETLSVWRQQEKALSASKTICPFLGQYD